MPDLSPPTRSPSAPAAPDNRGATGSPDRPLNGRRSLITGGSGALGRSVVRAFVEAGAAVHVPIFDASEVPALEEAMGGEMQGVTLHHDVDLTDTGSVDALMRGLPDLDIVAHLAGGFAMAPIEATAPESWDRMIQMNATSAFLVCRGAFRALRGSGRGRILTVSAMPALDRGASGMTAYAASKAAVLSLTHSLAREGAEHGITANAILPSILDTPANRSAMPDADTSTWIRPDEVAQVLAFLASDAGAVVTGAAVPLTRTP